MIRSLFACLFLILTASFRPITQQPEFTCVDLVIDSGGTHLAAWQIELVDTHGVARIVGIEGGEHPAFAAPPYYDTRALQQGRIVLAAFQTAGELPAGRVRVARVHVQIAGDVAPAFQVRLVTAADAQGHEFPARAELGS